MEASQVTAANKIQPKPVEQLLLDKENPRLASARKVIVRKNS